MLFSQRMADLKHQREIQPVPSPSQVREMARVIAGHRSSESTQRHARMTATEVLERDPFPHSAILDDLTFKPCDGTMRYHPDPVIARLLNILSEGDSDAG